jgi:hypothetical protein
MEAISERPTQKHKYLNCHPGEENHQSSVKQYVFFSEAVGVFPPTFQVKTNILHNESKE